MDKPLTSSSIRTATVRVAEYSDAVYIQDCLWQCQQETDTPYPDPDIPYAGQKLMQQCHEGMAAVAVDPEGRIVGAMVLSLQVWPWKHPDTDGALFLQNDHFYIQKPYRRGGTAKKLLDWAKKRAEEMDKLLVLDFATIDADVELKDRFARINGFKYAGGKFLRLPSSDQQGA